MNKGTAIVGFFLCFLAGMGLMWSIDHSTNTKLVAEGGHGADHGPAGDHSGAAIPIYKDDPTWGNPNAPVTIVEISDYQCPFCKRVEPTIEQIKKQYGKDKVRIVWKNNPLPFHKRAKPAHEAAMAVFKAGGDEAFWKFHEKAFENQRQLTDANFKKWAAEAGVPAAKFEATLKSQYPKSKVTKDLAFGKKIGARGTPNFRINGVELSGAQPLPKFKEIIDAELKAAAALKAKGVAAKDVYVKRTAENFKKKPEKKDRPERKEDTTVWKIPVSKDDPVKGPSDALVTIVEWSDFQCPFCTRVEPTIKKVMEAYPKDVRVVWKDNPLPFHKRAKPAAMLAQAAYDKGGDKLFWEAHKKLFAGQKGKFTDEQLGKIGKELGVDYDAIKDSEKLAEKIDASQELGQDFEARGTPHFFINGRRLSGAQPFANFKKLIDEKLAEAKKLVAAGTPREKIYEKVTEKGKAPPPPEMKTPPPITADNPVMGKKTAKVIIHEFSDFQCPFCKRVLPTLEQLKKEFGDDVAVVWHHMPLPFHKDAPLASEASMEAFEQKGADGFWKMHDKLFANQRNIKRQDLEKYAEEIGLDMQKFKAALDNNTHKAKIDADVAAAKKVGVRGTPAFIVGKYFLSGAQPYGKFKKLVKLAMKDK